MKKLTPRMTLLPILLLTGIFALTSLACSVGGMNLNKDSATISITLKEDTLNKLISQSTADYANQSGDDLFNQINSIEMHEGFVRVLGTARQADGTEVNGSYDASFAVENDALKVKIIAVDVPDVDLNDPRILKINQALEKDFSQSVAESNGEVLFKEATVTDDSLKLKVQVNFNHK